MHHRMPYTYIHFDMERCLIYLQRHRDRYILVLTPLALRSLFIIFQPFSPTDSQDGSNPFHSSVPGPMSSPPNQYLFRVMKLPNLHVKSIVDISCVLPVYIRHICDRHHLELSGSVPVITRKGRFQEDVPYHLGDVISHALDVQY